MSVTSIAMINCLINILQKSKFTIKWRQSWRRQPAFQSFSFQIWYGQTDICHFNKCLVTLNLIQRNQYLSLSFKWLVILVTLYQIRFIRSWTKGTLPMIFFPDLMQKIDIFHFNSGSEKAGWEERFGWLPHHHWPDHLWQACWVCLRFVNPMWKL